MAIGQTEILEFNPGAEDTVFQNAIFDGQFIFTANTTADGFEPWISDGTSLGTAQLSDIVSGSGSSFPFFFTQLGSLCVFRAEHPGYGVELWVTDGTEAGTELLLDAEPGFISGIGEPQLTLLCDYLYFEASSSGFGQELWRTDGTSSGTVRLTDIHENEASSSIEWITASDGILFFVATDDFTNHELYVYDPTWPGTYEVLDINGQSSASSFSDFWPVAMAHFEGNEVMFAADDGANGKELWISDGLGGSMVKDINPGGDSDPAEFFSHNGLMYFFADDGTNGRELWVSDGTEGGTNMVVDAVAGASGTIDAWVASFGDLLVFKTTGNGPGSELWITDGTSEGSSMIDQIDGIQADHAQEQFEGLFFFGANKSGSGIEVFATDGTTEGTGLFADVYAGFQHGQPHSWLEFDNKLWFISKDGDGQNLYSISQAQAQGFCDQANDLCSGAEPLAVNGVATQTKSFSCAADNGDQLCGSDLGSSLWYEFTAPASGSVDYEIALFGQAFGDFNPMVSIVEGSCEALSDIQCLNNNLVNEDESGNVAGLTEGNQYYLVLHDPAAGKGLYSITLTENEACAGDYSLDGQVDGSDLLIFLTYYGCMSDCEGDLNGDDVVLSDDLLIFLTIYGTTCP